MTWLAIIIKKPLFPFFAFNKPLWNIQICIYIISVLSLPSYWCIRISAKTSFALYCLYRNIPTLNQPGTMRWAYRIYCIFAHCQESTKIEFMHNKSPLSFSFLPENLKLCQMVELTEIHLHAYIIYTFLVGTGHAASRTCVYRKSLWKRQKKLFVTFTYVGTF